MNWPKIKDEGVSQSEAATKFNITKIYWKTSHTHKHEGRRKEKVLGGRVLEIRFENSGKAISPSFKVGEDHVCAHSTLDHALGDAVNDPRHCHEHEMEIDGT